LDLDFGFSFSFAFGVFVFTSVLNLDPRLGFGFQNKMVFLFLLGKLLWWTSAGPAGVHVCLFVCVFVCLVVC
jgi:hypothetical protein